MVGAGQVSRMGGFPIKGGDGECTSLLVCLETVPYVATDGVDSGI